MKALESILSVILLCERWRKSKRRKINKFSLLPHNIMSDVVVSRFCFHRFVKFSFVCAAFDSFTYFRRLSFEFSSICFTVSFSFLAASFHIHTQYFMSCEFPYIESECYLQKFMLFIDRKACRDENYYVMRKSISMTKVLLALLFYFRNFWVRLSDADSEYFGSFERRQTAFI